MRPLVSVIVPVYRVEDVLERCLDSLCRQSLQNIEILLIDDASPDRCGAICEVYAERDTRFRVVHHPENRGLSIARNTGIAYASADYIMLADSDDWVHENFCKLPYECAVQSGADLVMFRFQGMKRDDSINLAKKAINGDFVYQTRLQAMDLLLSEVKDFAWNKLYRKKLFEHVSYPEGKFYEDIGTTYKTVLLADTICFLDTVLYFYCRREDSITMLKTEKALQDWFDMSMHRYHDLAEWGYPSEKVKFMLYNIALSYCIKKKADMEDSNYAFCRKTLQNVKGIPENFTWRRKIMFVLLKYFPPLFDLVCVLWKKRWKIVE